MLTSLPKPVLIHSVEGLFMKLKIHCHTSSCNNAYIYIYLVGLGMPVKSLNVL